MSWVNAVEVLYRVERDHGRPAAEQVLEDLRGLVERGPERQRVPARATGTWFRWRYLPTRANGRPAVAAYSWDDGARLVDPAESGG